MGRIPIQNGNPYGRQVSIPVFILVSVPCERILTSIVWSFRMSMLKVCWMKSSYWRPWFGHRRSAFRHLRTELQNSRLVIRKNRATTRRCGSGEGTTRPRRMMTTRPESLCKRLDSRSVHTSCAFKMYWCFFFQIFFIQKLKIYLTFQIATF